MSRRRIVISPTSNSIAHAGRCLLLARELKGRGHEVILAGTRKYFKDPEIVREDEFDYYEVEDFENEEGLAVLRIIKKRFKNDRPDRIPGY